MGSHLTEAMAKEGAKVKESKYRDKNQRPFIRHCDVLMAMAIPPFRHCESTTRRAKRGNLSLSLAPEIATSVEATSSQ